MNKQHSSAALGLALGTGLATCMVLAQEPYVAQAPYYDPVRDVMVTPPATPPLVLGSRNAPDVVPRGGNTFELIVRNGQLWEGPREFVVSHGSNVTLTVDSDLPDTLSVGGYNYRVAFAAGQPMLLTFNAERPGLFPITLGRTGRTIATLEVGPPRPG